MDYFISEPSKTNDEDWNPVPETSSPIWILGKQLCALKEGRADLFENVQSLFWFTYRKDFEEIATSGFTSDKGWGCMLRCGQMVVGEALRRNLLGKDWQWTTETKDEVYLKTLSVFADQPDAPLGIHQIAVTGEDTENKPVGTWFGPNTVAQVLKKIVKKASDVNLNVHIALDNTVILDEIRAGSLSGDIWCPLLLFVPLRLGLTEVNSIYFPDLKECFEMPQSIGVIGGRPNHALYFIGYVDEQLIFLDPHTTHSSGNIGSKSTEDEVQLDCTYHTDQIGSLDMERLDPSLALCFFCESESSFDDLSDRLLNRLVRGHSTPLFEICRQRPAHMCPDYEPPTGPTGATARSNEEEEEEEDEFEFL